MKLISVTRILSDPFSPRYLKAITICINFVRTLKLVKSRYEQSYFQHSIDCVIHFAALKAVGESVRLPLMYYGNNVTGSANLMEVSLHIVVCADVRCLHLFTFSVESSGP